MKLAFGDIVVVDKINIGVVVKCWNSGGKRGMYEVYVRMEGGIKLIPANKIERYMVRHKYLNKEELMYQANALE